MKEKVTVVLSGCGVRYPYHVGALKAISEKYEIAEIVGTSGGAIIAAAYASGFGFDKSSNYLPRLLTHLKPSKLIKYNLWPFSKPYGLIEIKPFIKEFEKYFIRPFHATLIPLHIVTTNLSTGKEHVFSSLETPDQSIPQAVAASMAIPIVFDYVLIDKEIHVDGGLCSNLLVDLPTSNKIIGVNIRGTKKVSKSFKSFKSYASAAISTMVEQLEIEDIEDNPAAIIINIQATFGGLDFDVSVKEIVDMMMEGLIQTRIQLG